MPELDAVTPEGLSWQHQLIRGYGDGLLLQEPVRPLAAAQKLMAKATDVIIDMDAVERVAATIEEMGTPLAWGPPYPNCASGATADEVVSFALAVSSLNFCFWSPHNEPRWQVEGATGAFALVNAFARARERGVAVNDPRWLASCSESELSSVLKGEGEGPSVPLLMKERCAILNELGVWLGKHERPSAALGHHQDAFAGAVALGSELDGFRDVLSGDGPVAVPFLKRAQMAMYGMGDLLGQQAPAWLLDRSRLTAFADYRVPQVIRHLGVLIYSNRLASIVDSETLIAPGSGWELEIRGGGVVGVSEISNATKALGKFRGSSELDGLFWKLAKVLPGMAPHHRTLTIWY